jgi:hypothetical protein
METRVGVSATAVATTPGRVLLLIFNGAIAFLLLLFNPVLVLLLLLVLAAGTNVDLLLLLAIVSNY